MTFASLLAAFWMPFGCLLDVFWMLFGARDFLGLHFGKFDNFDDFWSVTGVKNSSHLDTKSVLLTTFRRYIFYVFLATQFSNILQFWDPFGIQFRSIFEVPGNLENVIKTLKGA